MRCERISGLGRHLANLNKDASDTYAQQWFERTLDDSYVLGSTNPLFSSLLKLYSSVVRSQRVSVRFDLLYLPLEYFYTTDY